MRQALESHPPHTLQPSLARLLPLVISTVNEEWFKIIAESLRVFGAIITVARPDHSAASLKNNTHNQNKDDKDNNKGDDKSNKGDNEFDYAPLVRPIYDALLPRLEALDIDQEIKECSISTVGKLFAVFGDHLSDQLPIVLSLLRKRLDNENTRTPTLKALAVMATSNLNLNLSYVIDRSTTELSLFLRQQSRGLKQTTLSTLDALISSHSAVLEEHSIFIILQEASSLVNDSDLHLTHLTFVLTLSILKKVPSSATVIKQFIYPKMVILSGSSLLQGAALNSMVSLFQALVCANTEGTTFEDILDTLYNRYVRKYIHHTYRCMHMHTYTHTYIHTHVHTYIHVLVLIIPPSITY